MPLRVQRGTSISFEEPLPDEEIINVPQIKQEQRNWCWAACAEMILYYYRGTAGTPTQQCKFADKLFCETECCSEPYSSACNRPCEIRDVSALYSSQGIHSKLVNNPVPFSTLQSEIGDGRPVEVAYFRRDSEEPGHLVIVRGWRIDGNEEFVHVNDPADSPPSMSGIVAYSELLAPYGTCEWTCTWIEIRRQTK